MTRPRLLAIALASVVVTGVAVTVAELRPTPATRLLTTAEGSSPPAPSEVLPESPSTAATETSTAPPSTSAAPATSSPRPSTTAPAATSTAPAPATVPPPAPFVLPPEGSSAVLAVVQGKPAMTVTTVRLDGGPGVVVACDQSLLSFDLRPGGDGEPGGAFPGHPDLVSVDDPTLVAAFNSGFMLKNADSRGGWYLAGTTARPLRDGAASLVFLTDGTVRVVQWGRDRRMGPDVVGVRQNLDLLVDHGVANPSAKPDRPEPWGEVFKTGIATTRSGVGTRSDGSLVYVEAPHLSPAGIAQLMVQQGVVSGMQLDINPLWPLFTVVTRNAGGARIDKLSPSMRKGADTFTTPSIRDFVAVFRRAPETDGQHRSGSQP